MEKQNWIEKLTDDNILEIVKRLMSDRPNKRFVKILKIERKDSSIEILFESKKLKSYLTYSEDKITLYNHKVGGGHKLSVYAETMVEIFGEEYKQDFLNIAEKYVAENENDTLSKKYQKAIRDVSKLVTENVSVESL